MRLRDRDREAIRDAVRQVFGPTAVVRLFGSRVRDELKGGDIDLHVETDPRPDQPAIRLSARLWGELQERLGEQRIDIVVTERGRQPTPIAQVAYRDGVIV